MKKVLAIAALAALSSGAYAQNGIPQPSFNDSAPVLQYDAARTGSRLAATELPQPSFVDYVDIRADAGVRPVLLSDVDASRTSAPTPSFNG